MEHLNGTAGLGGCNGAGPWVIIIVLVVSSSEELCLTPLFQVLENYPWPMLFGTEEDEGVGEEKGVICHARGVKIFSKGEQFKVEVI